MNHKCEYCDKDAVVESKIKSKSNSEGWAYMCLDHWNDKGYQLLGYYRYLQVPETELSDEHLSLIIKLFYGLDKRDHLYTSVRNKLIIDKKTYDDTLQHTKDLIKTKLKQGMITQSQYDEYDRILSNM